MGLFVKPRTKRRSSAFQAHFSDKQDCMRFKQTTDQAQIKRVSNAVQWQIKRISMVRRIAWVIEK